MRSMRGVPLANRLIDLAIRFVGKVSEPFGRLLVLLEAIVLVLFAADGCSCLRDGHDKRVRS